MTGAALAEARHRLYGWLGRLWVEGPRPEVLAIARRVPGLAEALAGDAEDLAAGHHAAVTDVPCAASAVLGVDGLVGGPVAEAVAAAYAEVGFFAGRADVPVDHVGTLLACAGHACLAPAPFPASARFLDAHLLSWLPAWTVAVAAADPRWGEVAALTLELAASHRASLPGGIREMPLPGPPVALAPDQSLDDVAAMLIRPARSGWLLGRTALLRACAAAGVAGGLGDRARMLGAALRGAAAVGRLGALVEALLGSVDEADRALAARAAAMPVLGPAVAAWRARLAATRGALRDLALATPEVPAAPAR